MSDDYKSGAMRQKIVHQIEETLRITHKSLKKSPADVEASIFKIAKSKDDYMNYISKILGHLKENQQAPNNTSHLTALLSAQPGSNQQINQGVTSGGQMTIGSQGNQMFHMTSQQQPNQMINSQVASSSSMGHMPQQQPMNKGMSQQMVSGNAQAPNMQMTNPMMSNMTRMPQGMQSNNPNDMNWQQMNKVRRSDMIMLNNQKHGAAGGMIQMNAAKMGGMAMSPNDQMNTMGGQMPRIMQPRVPSPGYSANMTMGRPPTPSSLSSGSPGMQHLNPPHMTFITPSPQSGPVASPASVGPRSIGQLGAPSPTGMLGTPGPHMQQPSPLGGANLDEKAYIEKVRQLQHKYADTLKTVAMKFSNNDSERGRNVLNLLEVLENPHRRASMDTLRRCEVVLERLGMQQRLNRGELDPVKKDNPIGVLLDALNNAMKYPNGAHTIQRTLGPAMKTLFGSDLIPKIRKRKLSELLPDNQQTHTVNDTIQGEVARLPARFKVNMDSQQIAGSDDLTLVCRLDDPHLPCVPPINMIIPPNYPRSVPKTTLPVVDYSVTPFLKRVREIMNHRQFDLPESCTITKILNTWEMSVRQACSPKPFNPNVLNPLVNLTALTKEEKVST